MTIEIRPAELSDMDQLTPLLLADAKDRCASNAGLWKLETDPRGKLHSTIQTAMTAESPPFRQKWLVAESEGALVGVTHSILLPVPPIYAGEFGPPGLIMEDCYVAPDAPAGTKKALFKAAEADLINAGALILLTSSITGGDWEQVCVDHGYDALTRYFAKTGLTQTGACTHVQPATEIDVPAIVASSAIHRSIINDLHHQFWKPHTDANSRFGSWMKRSLDLADRNIFVCKTQDAFHGYAISQPATSLHFPTPHDISGVGFIDDFFHDALKTPKALGQDNTNAATLIHAAEAARQQRGDHSVLVVCPAAWGSKIKLLEQVGYHNELTWFIKVVA